MTKLDPDSPGAAIERHALTIPCPRCGVESGSCQTADRLPTPTHAARWYDAREQYLVSEAGQAHVREWEKAHPETLRCPRCREDVPLAGVEDGVICCGYCGSELHLDGKELVEP